MGDVSDVQRFKDRVNTDPVPVLQDMLKLHGFSMDQNKVHFRVGHAKGLDHVFDRLASLGQDLAVDFLSGSRQEIV